MITKRKKVHFAIPAVLAAALLLSASPMLANTNAGAMRASASQQTRASQDPPASPQGKKKAQTYEGTIVVGSNGTCKLKVGKYEYKLTDQAEASRYANRKVIVTGVYQRKTGTIRVQKIKAA